MIILPILKPFCISQTSLFSPSFTIKSQKIFIYSLSITMLSIPLILNKTSMRAQLIYLSSLQSRHLVCACMGIKSMNVQGICLFSVSKSIINVQLVDPIYSSLFQQYQNNIYLLTFISFLLCVERIYQAYKQSQRFFPLEVASNIMSTAVSQSYKAIIPMLIIIVFQCNVIAPFVGNPSLPISQARFKYFNDMMKKAKQLKQARKTNQTFFKYIQPSKPAAFSHQTKTHTRSMMQLESNVRYQQTAREPSHCNKQNHQMSLCNQSEEPEQEVKSNSLKKFLSLFGTNNHNNPILNPSGNSLRLSTGRQEKSTSRGSNRQVFTCNIKNMNVNVSNSKEKEHLENKTTLILKQKTESNSLISHLRHQKEEIKNQLEMITLQYNEKEKLLKQKVKAIQAENAALKKDIATMHDEKLIMQEKSALRERSLEKTIESMQRNAGKERCRQHDLIIESLKKVINQQLRKIIELEKSKIEREEIQKLQERINLNMTGNQVSLEERIHYMEVKELLKLSKRDDLLRMAKKQQQIKIDDSFNESALTSQQDHSRFQMIEEAEQSQEFSREKSQEDGDSILQEVDKYLIQWRNKH